jgi:tetratricopeptide (TPR) repeat protein
MGQDGLATTHPTRRSKIECSHNTLSLDHKDALSVLGYVFFQHHQSDKALILFKALNVLFPQDTHIRLSLAYAYLINGGYARALELAEHSDTESKTVPGALIKIRALWALNRKDEARQQFQNGMNGQRLL